MSDSLNSISIFNDSVSFLRVFIFSVLTIRYSLAFRRRVWKQLKRTLEGFRDNIQNSESIDKSPRCATICSQRRSHDAITTPYFNRDSPYRVTVITGESELAYIREKYLNGRPSIFLSTFPRSLSGKVHRVDRTSIRLVSLKSLFRCRLQFVSCLLKNIFKRNLR